MPRPRERSNSPDAVDIFADSLESLYDHHVPAHGDPLQLYTYIPPADATCAYGGFTVRLPPQQVNELFAHHVWNSSLRLADGIALDRVRVRDETVLELGSGAGISGLMAARAGGAKRVILSDYDDPKIVSNLRENVAMALKDCPEIRTRVAAFGHTWGEADSMQQLLRANSSQRFTTILLADTLWMSSGHDALLSSLSQSLAHSASAQVVVCAGFHSGRATVRSFLRKAARIGLVCKGAWQELGVDGRRRPWGWDRPDPARQTDGSALVDNLDAPDEWDELEDASERNRWVVEGTLGWSDEAFASDQR